MAKTIRFAIPLTKPQLYTGTRQTAKRSPQPAVYRDQRPNWRGQQHQYCAAWQVASPWWVACPKPHSYPDKPQPSNSPTPGSTNPDRSRESAFIPAAQTTPTERIFTQCNDGLRSAAGLRHCRH